MTPQDIALISNPESTRMKRDLGAVRDVLARYPGVLHRELTSVDEIGDVLSECAQQGIKLVIINGGDGTIHAAVTAVFNEGPFEILPVFAALPGGRTNMTVEALGGYLPPARHLDTLLDAALDPDQPLKTTPLPFVCLHLRAGDVPVYGTFFGTATVVRGIEFCRRVIYPVGLPNFLSHSIAILYLTLVAISPFKTKRSPMRREPIAVNFGDSAVAPQPYFILLATTLDRLIMGLTTTSGIGEGSLRYTSVEYSAGAMIRSLWALLFGRPAAKIVRGLTRRRVATMEIRSDCPVTLDGEFYQPVSDEPVRISASAPLTFVRYEDE